MALSQGAPRRRRVDRRLPALSSLRGHRPAQEHRCAAVANQLMSTPISDRMTWALSSLTPGMVLSCSDGVTKGGEPGIDLPIDRGDAGIERVDLLQMEIEQEAMVSLDARAKGFAQPSLRRPDLGMRERG